MTVLITPLITNYETFVTRKWKYLLNLEHFFGLKKCQHINVKIIVIMIVKLIHSSLCSESKIKIFKNIQ